MQAVFFFTQAGGIVITAVVQRRFAPFPNLAQISVNLVNIRHLGGAIHPYPRSGFVYQVNRLVGQKSLGDIAGGEFNGRLHRLIRNFQIVVLFISTLHPHQNLYSFFGVWFVHLDGLEAPFQRRIAFDVLAVLVQRGRPNALQFPTRQRRLEDIGRIHRATSRASTHQHMHLVNKQDGIARFQLFNDALEAFLKLAAIHGARNQTAHIELQDALVLQYFRDAPFHNALRQPFDDGRFAHAGFPNQGRVVFGAPRQNLDNALNFHRTADNRVKLALFSHRR